MLASCLDIAQNRFRMGHGMLDQAMNFDFILKKLHCHGLSGCAVLLDIKSTYDQVDHGILWQQLFNRGICGNLLEVVQLLFNDCQLHIGLNSFKPEQFLPVTGLLQGSVHSPFLFNVYIYFLLPQVAL